jgi:UDP-N-acetylglucosamine 2-epimerase (non-hydrolysing)
MVESEVALKRICVVIGTRPEAIKMAPVIRGLKEQQERGWRLDLRVCVTAQHREMLDQVLSLFDIVPDWDLNIMRDGQDLTDITSRVLAGLRGVYQELKPDVVIVHGDTTTTFAAALAAYYQQIPVAHVEAGLRTRDIYSPWPEELNRRLTGAITTWHFAPTENARLNLIREGVASESIEVTGNTVVDALIYVSSLLDRDEALCRRFSEEFSYLDAQKRLIVVTGHRRENFGEGFENICSALRRLAQRADVEIIYPVHLNPNVQGPVYSFLGDHPSIHLLKPLEYLPFVYLMKRAYLILTDSGGIQEEAPSLGKPVLVMRKKTERPEGIEAGTIKLVGTDQDAIVRGVSALLDDSAVYDRMARASNPYGDGCAGSRIAATILKH